MNNTGWNDPLGGVELPYDGRSIFDTNRGGSSSGGSGGSNGCGCSGCSLFAGALFLAALGGVLVLLVILFR